MVLNMSPNLLRTVIPREKIGESDRRQATCLITRWRWWWSEKLLTGCKGMESQERLASWFGKSKAWDLVVLLFCLTFLLVKIKSLWGGVGGTSLVAQWLRIHLPVQGTRVRALVQEDPTCCGATKPRRHNYWACALEPTSHNYGARVPQVLKPTHVEPVLHNKEKPPQWEDRAPQWRVASARSN